MLFIIKTSPKLHSQQCCTRAHFSLHPGQNLFLFDNSYPKRYKAVSHCDFDLYFPDD
jgi:hypothetical protein